MEGDGPKLTREQKCLERACVGAPAAMIQRSVFKEHGFSIRSLSQTSAGKIQLTDENHKTYFFEFEGPNSYTITDKNNEKCLDPKVYNDVRALLEKDSAVHAALTTKMAKRAISEMIKVLSQPEVKQTDTHFLSDTQGAFSGKVEEVITVAANDDNYFKDV